MNKVINCLIIIILTVFIYNLYFNQYTDEIIIIKNPINSKDMLWKNNHFTRNNWPGPDFQAKQKKNAFKYILEKGRGVIDCGSHIGDFGIPLALALKDSGRNDIIVYCIDPSKEKCDFIEKMKVLNNLNNIKVINSGIADKEGKYSIENIHYRHFTIDGLIKNTGAFNWAPDENGINFTTLDKLYSKKIINDVGFVWLDVEYMEYYFLLGGKKFLKQYKPYILMEYHDGRNKLKNDTKFIDLFDELGIKISEKGNNGDFEDILLEFN